MVNRRLFRVGKLIDGTGAAPIGKAAVLIEGSRILAAGRAADLGLPDGAEIIDAPQATLIPGLIDAHVHLAYSGSLERTAFRNEHADLNYAEIALRAAGFARDTLRAGYTSVRDMHAPGGTVIDLRRAIERQHVTGPRIIACGQGLSITGGHMDQPGWADHAQFSDLTAPCDGPEGFRRGVRDQLKRGADFIKLNTGTSTHRVPGVHGRLEMSAEEIRTACEEAHRNEVHVAAHCVAGDAIAVSVENGVDCIEHAHFTDQAIIDLMAERGTYFVPTLLVNERNFEIDRSDIHIAERHWQWLEQSREAKWRTLAAARQTGVRICAGSDAGFMLPHGPMNWREIALLVEGGLTPLEAICAATATNADLLDIPAGRIVAGRLADLVLVDGDPLSDIAVLGEPDRLTVYLGGERIT